MSPTGPNDPPDDIPNPVSKETLKNFPFAMVLADPHQPDMPIVYVNRRFMETTGYSFDAAVGRNCRFLQGERTDPMAVARIRAAIEAREELTLDLMNYRADGTPFHNRLLIAPLNHDDGTLQYFLGVQTVVEPLDSPFEQAADLTEQLRELQHRVKNHLSMVLGMIRAEARSRPPEDVIELLTQRVEAISILYDSLSNTGNGASETVDLGAYVSKVASSLHMIDNRSSVRFNVSVDSFHTNVDLAGRTGLYLSEVVTNALQHGLDGRDEGVVGISLRKEEGRLVLTVTDDGNGMGEADWPNGRSIGSMVVRDFVSRANADLRIDERDGTSVTVRIPVDA